MECDAWEITPFLPKWSLKVKVTYQSNIWSPSYQRLINPWERLQKELKSGKLFIQINGYSYILMSYKDIQASRSYYLYLKTQP